MSYENIVRLISLTVGCFYPAFASFRYLNAVQRPPNDPEGQCIWLTYWTVYGVYSMFDFISTDLADCVPFVSEFKLGFLFWLLPTVGAGSQVIYEEFLHSFFSHNERAIEHILIDGSIAIVDCFDQILRFAVRHIMAVVDDYLLTRGERPGVAVPVAPPRVDDMLANMRMDRLQKEAKTEDLVNEIEKILGSEADENDHTLCPNDADISESDPLMCMELSSKRKPKKSLPKPSKIETSTDPKPEELNPNQNVVSADETEVREEVVVTK